MLACNPLRTDFQEHYEGIVAAYNREKDRVTIEQTFEASLKLGSELDEEENRAVREGLDEESLAIFDLLKRPDPNPGDIKANQRSRRRIAGEAERGQAPRRSMARERSDPGCSLWRPVSSLYRKSWMVTRSDDCTGADVETKTEEVFLHVYRAYPTVPSPYYSTSSVA